MDGLAQSVLEVASSLEWRLLFERALWGVGGAFVSLLAAYVVLGRDVSYIKGKLDQLTDNTRTVQRLDHDVQTIKARIGISHHG